MTSVAMKKADPRRIAELKRKIEDEEYLSSAIQRIAQVLSVEILDMNGELHERHERGKY
jgi:hypothetical protein